MTADDGAGAALLTPQNAVLSILRDRAIPGAEDIAADVLSVIEVAIRAMPLGYRPQDVADEIAWCLVTKQAEARLPERET